MAEISKISAVAIANVAKVDAVLKANIANINDLTIPSAFTGLLDTYTGAAAAYSTRRLYSLYTGAALRVREDSGDTETDIGFDSNGDLDTAAIASHCGSANGYVTKWYGQESSGGTGSGNDAAQATNANQPQIYNGSAVITDNGQAALSFDGSNDFFGSIAVASATANTLTWVGNPDQVVGGSQRIFARPNASANQLRLDSDDFVFSDYEIGPVQVTQALEFAVSAVQALIFGYITNANKTARIAYNGGTFNVGATLTKDLQLIGTAETDAKLGSKRDGANNYYDGKMQEFVLWTSDQSSNRTGIEGNMNAHFQIGNFGTPTSGLLATYTGAAAAYSVRQLANTAALAMRIREDGTDTETDIGFDSNGDLDTAAISSHCGSNNGYVVTWYDQAGSQVDATQSTTTAQPQIYNGTAVITENGKPAVYFAGNQRLDHGLPTNAGYSTDHGLFSVGRIVTRNDYAVWFGAGINADATNGVCQISSIPQQGGSLEAWGTYQGGPKRANSSLNDGSQHLCVMHRGTTGDGTFRLDGSTDGTYSGTSGTTSKSVGHYNTKDNIQEIVFYNSEPSSSDISGIENNVNTYFSIY